MPGWYPDPAGTPNHYRYWDGQQWSAHSTPNPQDGDPGPAEPQGRGPLILIVALLVAIALVVAGVLLVRSDNGGTGPAKEDTNSSTPTISAWDETSKPSVPPSQPPSEPDPSGAEWTTCPSGANRPERWDGGDLEGGGLIAASIDGWRDGGTWFLLPWLHDSQAQIDKVASSGLVSWFSASAVGAVSVADGFDSPRTAAQYATDCFATSDYYSGFTGSKQISSQEISVDGHSAWWIRSEVYVEMPSLPDVPGDVIDIVAVDTGDPESIGMYISSATLGDDSRQQQVDAARDSLRVR